MLAAVFDWREFQPAGALKIFAFFSRQRLPYPLQGQTSGLPATNAPGCPFKKSEKKSCQSRRHSISLARNLTQPMEKLMIRIVFKPFGCVGATLAAAVAIPLVFSSSAFAQNPEATPGARATGAAAAVGQPAAPLPPEPTAGTAEAPRVVVTGSNIPTAEETGPNPVDT